MKRLLAICVAVALVFAVSGLSPASAQDINPGPLEVSVSALEFTPPPQPGSILLLDDGGSPGQEGKQALDNFGYTYTHASPTDLATTNLDDFDIIYVAWYPTQAMVDALNARKADLESWISRGGGIVVNAEFKNPPRIANPYSFLPVTFDTDDSASHTNGVHIVEPTHPLADGLTDALLDPWGNSVHGKITVYPPEATVVSVATSLDDSPHIVGMCYGGGKIVVVASDPEFHVVYGPGDGPKILLCNELSWAAIPCVITVEIDIKPGSFPSSINLKKKGVTPVAIHTTEDFDATTVNPLSVMLNDCGPPVHWEVYDCDELPNPLYGDPLYPDEPEMIGDGDIDLVLYFDTQALAEGGCLKVGDTEATLTGETLDGVPIEGTGDVRIVIQGPKT